MAVIKIKNRTRPFAIVDKAILEDSRLSLKAKGIMCYLLSFPDSWNTRIPHLVNTSKEGRDSVMNGVKELIEFGYLVKKLRRKDGRLDGYEYTVHEAPVFERPEKGKRRKLTTTIDGADSFIEYYGSIKPTAIQDGMFEQMRKDFDTPEKSAVTNYFRNIPYEQFLKTKYWRTLSVEVRKRAGRACVECAATQRLEAHHLAYEGVLGAEIDNMDKLVCLCRNCHQEEHNKKTFK